MISAIVAVSANNVIGKEGGVPWYLPGELAYFKQVTMGHPIIMGRKTHQSIGRALTGRTNIVVTRQPDFQSEGCQVAGSLDQAIDLAKKSEGSDEIFIIGGAEIYKLAMPLLDRIYLTKVHAQIAGDKFFKYDPKGWRETSKQSHSADDKNKYSYDTLVLENLKLA